jgi:fumarylacetoacetate (FAA) hydrolase family protein
MRAWCPDAPGNVRTSGIDMNPPSSSSGMPDATGAAAEVLPADHGRGTLVGRLWMDSPLPGPRTVVVRQDGLYDLSGLAPTISDLCDLDAPVDGVRAHAGSRLCSLDEALARGALLAPCDLQAIKAAGVTFADSLIERVIEERARGDAHAAQELRVSLIAALGGNLRGVQPGSAAAAAARNVLVQSGMWSQYLEVGIGADAEIFTKALPLSAVGCGAEIGVSASSNWSVPEPEVVLAVSSRGKIVGATLGNDVTLRDLEGRSALLLGRAKDNNASCAIGPFLRLFDDAFTLDDVRSATVHLRVDGTDGFVTEGTSSMALISRDPVDLVAATMGVEHQYPDGLMLFLGTMFVPTADRHEAGLGFTHAAGDVVRIASARLGTLVNTVAPCHRAPPWRFGLRALMASLAARGLLR